MARVYIVLYRTVSVLRPCGAVIERRRVHHAHNGLLARRCLGPQAAGDQLSSALSSPSAASLEPGTVLNATLRRFQALIIITANVRSDSLQETPSPPKKVY